MEYPKNQMDFEKMFATEQQCIDFITSIRWPNGFVCSNCNSIFYWHQSRRRFTCKKCHFETTVISNTIFHGSRKPLALWFRAIWWMIAQKNGVSAKGLQKILGLGSYQTAWTWLHKFRRLMVLPDREKLKGIIEVDETLIGGKKSGKRGRGAEGKSLIVIAVEVINRKTGRIRLAKIPNALSKSLKEFITNNVEKGSTIITDGWSGYKNLSNLGYNHEIQSNLVIDIDGEILPNAHRIASLLIRWLLGTHQSYLNKNKLEYYLDEYTFRYNRRTSKSRGLLFYRLIEQAVVSEPVTYKKIIN